MSCVQRGLRVTSSVPFEACAVSGTEVLQTIARCPHDVSSRRRRRNPHWAAESERGRGIGRALMSAAEHWALERGAAYVSLASRRAGEFYTALGYDNAATFFKKPLA